MYVSAVSITPPFVSEAGTMPSVRGTSKVSSVQTTDVLQCFDWDKLFARYSYTVATSPFADLVQLDPVATQQTPLDPDNEPDSHSEESHTTVFDHTGTACEVVQPRDERRKSQNRKAQRAYRARKEAQLKSASTTLAQKESQLNTLTHHNRELLDTIKHLRAVVTQLELENQHLKEVQSPAVDVLNEPAWFMESANPSQVDFSNRMVWDT